jgi:hypothetical protein
MFKMDRTNPRQGTTMGVLFLCLGLFCLLALLSPCNAGLTQEWFGHSAFEQHLPIDFEEEVWVFAFFVFAAVGISASPMRTAPQPVRAAYPAPQLPPPKSIS